MEDLEIHYDPVTKVSEAPLQLKSNLGTFLIDDFGRQRMQPIELLNRWIVPLEKRYDFLSLANGKKIRVPFDQLIIFSTNLEPKQLVDEAFLRRIPYKIKATDPTEEMFRKMIAIFAPKLGFEEVDRTAIDYLIKHHYQRVGRPFRCCQPRDLLLQVRNYCIYNDLPARAEARVLRLRRDELLHDDVSPAARCRVGATHRGKAPAFRWVAPTLRNRFSILDPELDLVRVAAQLGCVHRLGPGGQGVEPAGDLGAEAVGDAVLAPGQGPREEGHALVAELDVGAQVVAVVAAADLDRLEAGRLEVLEDQVLVVVLAVDLQLDLDQVAALERRPVGQQLAAITLDPLADRLAAAAGHVHRLVVLDEPVDLAVDLDLQARVGDRVFEREVGQVGVEVERALALLEERDRVLAGLPAPRLRGRTRCRT